MINMKYFSLLFISALASLSPLSTHSTNAEKNTFNYPGGVVEIRIDKKSSFLPEIQYGIHEPVIIEEQKNWRVLIGLDLETIPGEYLIYLKHDIDGASSEHIKFFVEQQNYPVRILNKKPKQVIKQVHLRLTKLDYENTQQPNLPLNFPKQGNWNLGFGTVFFDRRSKKTSTQNNIFYETNTIINVRSPENALISNIIIEKDGSSTVFLDHGRGLYSVIGGITDLNVEIGNGVVSGAVIGKVTPTANFKKNTVATKTLTWQCILNGIYVNPTILTQL